MVTNKPYSIQIEFVEGCSRICSFCGIQSIRNKAGNFKMMDSNLAKKIAFEISIFCPNARIEFAMHGEPTMHKDYIGMINIFRNALPITNMQLTTNGVRFRKGNMKEEVLKIFDAGIDYIILDTYYPERDELRKAAFEINGQDGIVVEDFYDDWVPNGKSPWHNHHRKIKKTVLLMDDLQARDGEISSRQIVNHAGNNKGKPQMAEPLKKTCTMPFRELSITWNGNINLCCQDWKHELVIENVGQKTIEEIWHSERFEAGRAMLQNKNREMKPCNKCDIGSGSRSGLLPKYPQVTDKQKEIVNMTLEQYREHGKN